MAFPCKQCRHFYISWDAAMPYGCRLYQFKAKVLPALAVEQQIGEACLGFSRKAPPPRSPESETAE